MSEMEQAAASTTEAVPTRLEVAEQKLYGNTEAQQAKPEETKVESAVESKEPMDAATEAKPATEETKAEGEKPEQPKFTLELDEDSPLKDEQVDEIAHYAKERGLSNEQAQELVNLQDKALRQFHAEQKQTIEAKRQEWIDLSSRDKEIGGTEFNANAELAKRVVDRFGSEDFKKTLNDTGLGNHPELLRVFTRIGKAMANDDLVIPRSQNTQSKSMEEIFYGSKT